ncbi:MAG: hypothetical protein KF819_15515 [Labilithrix sp.]|nr:hypothetical protein [Labilithrix sp.]
MSDDKRDPLLEALRELPTLASSDAAAEARHQRQARAAYARAFEARPGFAVSAGRAVVPLVLAGVVGIYLSWAIAAATALVH